MNSSVLQKSRGHAYIGHGEGWIQQVIITLKFTLPLQWNQIQAFQVWTPSISIRPYQLSQPQLGLARLCCCWSRVCSECYRCCGLHCCFQRLVGRWGLAVFLLFPLYGNRCTTRPPSGVLRSQMLQMQCPSRLGCPDHGKFVEELDLVP